MDAHIRPSKQPPAVSSSSSRGQLRERETVYGNNSYRVASLQLLLWTIVVPSIHSYICLVSCIEAERALAFGCLCGFFPQTNTNSLSLSHFRLFLPSQTNDNAMAAPSASNKMLFCSRNKVVIAFYCLPSVRPFEQHSVVAVAVAVASGSLHRLCLSWRLLGLLGWFEKLQCSANIRLRLIAVVGQRATIT